MLMHKPYDEENIMRARKNATTGEVKRLICHSSPIQLCYIMLSARHCWHRSSRSSPVVQTAYSRLFHTRSLARPFPCPSLGRHLVSARYAYGVVQVSQWCCSGSGVQRIDPWNTSLAIHVRNISSNIRYTDTAGISISSYLISDRWSCSGPSDYPSSGPALAIYCVCARNR